MESERTLFGAEVRYLLLLINNIILIMVLQFQRRQKVHLSRRMVHMTRPTGLLPKSDLLLDGQV